MSTVDADLYRRAAALLEPGDIELHGAVVHTEYGGDEESLAHQATLDVGDVVAEHRGVEEWYVYSGNDDPEFGLNQHQGRTRDDEFLWECQQLLREGSFDIVVYWEAGDDLDAILADIRAAGYEAVGVTEDGVADAGSRVA
ncbi:MAG: DUF5778 family protein [Halobacteriaceae archaeon]